MSAVARCALPRVAVSGLAALLALALLGAAAPGRAADAADAGAGADAAAASAVAAGADAAASAAGTAASSGRAPAPEGDQVVVVADSVARDERARLVVAEGAVEIRHRELRLVADRVVYQEERRDVIADGNVVLDSGEDRLQGEHLELNLETRVGFLTRAQGFVQTYYLTGERIEKRGPDLYFIRRGTFTTCEGQLPDWSFHATSTTVTVDEYLHAWNPSLHVKRLPVFYLPYAVFPIKRDRATGLLVPEIKYSDVDGLTVRNQLYWAPRDNFDATIGVDWLERTGWGVLGELRYLLAARTHGEADAYWVRNPDTGAERWVLSSRHSHELPLGLQAEAELFVQSDRQVIATYGETLEERSSQSSTSSFYINRSWSAYDFSVAGRREDSLVTERRTTLTRFPEVTVERTSARLFDTDLFLKMLASGVRLARDEESGRTETDRYHLAPEFTWPISLGGVATVIPGAGYALTWYSAGLDGESERRSVPFYRVALEGPRAYRIFEVGGEDVEKLKHLIEPRVTYFYTPEVDQANLPQFDSIDSIPKTNRIEYSLTNTLYAKVHSRVPKAFAAVAAPEGAEGAKTEGAAEPAPTYRTQELLWVKLSQSYHLDAADRPEKERFSAVDWDARTRPVPSVELSWRGNFDVYGRGIGYQNTALTWDFADSGSFRGEYRTARDSNQDFLDLGLTLGREPIRLEGRSRYNLADEAFVENRVGVTFVSQCWEIALGYVKWPTKYEYSLLISLKGIGTVVKI